MPDGVRYTPQRRYDVHGQYIVGMRRPEEHRDDQAQVNDEGEEKERYATDVGRHTRENEAADGVRCAEYHNHKADLRYPKRAGDESLQFKYGN